MQDLIRRQIDKQIESAQKLTYIERPPQGWLRTIREALGMGRAQLSRKMGISPQAIENAEKSEIADTISLKTLRNMATSLNCRLIYIIIPEEPLQKMVEKKIEEKAVAIAKSINHSMKLEDQGTSTEELCEQIKDIVKELKGRKNISIIWEDDQ